MPTPPDAATLIERLCQDSAFRGLDPAALVEHRSLLSVSAWLARRRLESAQAGGVTRPRWYTQAELAAQMGTVSPTRHC